MAQQYSLKWNNHQPNFISMFAMLRNSSALVDVTLAAEGRQLHAHKMVLSACSPYFHSLFVENPSRHPIVILKDVAFSDLRTIVDFMYYGEVNITQEELPQMLHSAKSLKVKGLTETESTSVMRSQSAEFAYEASGVGGAGEAAGDACGAGESALESTTGSGQHELASAPSRRTSAEPAEPTAKRKRRRRSSTGSGSAASLHVQPGDEHALTVSSVPPSSTPNPRRREYDTHQNAEPQNISIDELSVEHDPAMPPGGQWSMMEHSYPRYGNSCFGGAGAGALHESPTGTGAAYVNMHAQLDGDLGQYAALAPPSAHEPPSAQQQATPAPPVKRRRTTNPQSEENFQRALEAVRVGGIGFCKAARMFGVNNRTLWLEYKKKGYPNNRPSIKSRIKREHASPPPPPPQPSSSLQHKEHHQHQHQHQQQQQAALDHMHEEAHHHHHMAVVGGAAPHHHLSVGFVESRQLDLPLQTMNILSGLNFSSMQ